MTLFAVAPHEYEVESSMFEVQMKSGDFQSPESRSMGVEKKDQRREDLDLVMVSKTHTERGAASLCASPLCRWNERCYSMPLVYSPDSCPFRPQSFHLSQSI